MANYTDIQTMFPVQLPRMRDKDLSAEDYNASVAQNENNMNQNFAILYQELAELKARLGG